MDSPSNGIERQYTPVEIASIVKVKTRTVLGWLRDPNHRLKGVKHGTMWRVAESDLREFLKGEQ